MTLIIREILVETFELSKECTIDKMLLDYSNEKIVLDSNSLFSMDILSEEDYINQKNNNLEPFPLLEPNEFMIVEVLSKRVHVNSIEDAEDLYKSEEIVLTSDDFDYNCIKY